MAMLYRPLALQRETCVFPPVALKKPVEIFEQFLVNVTTLGRPTNTPNLIKIGSWGGAAGKREMSLFCDFCSPFFYVSSCRLQVVILDRFARFMAQTTCSDSYTCLFRVWSLQIHFHWVSSPKNTKIWPPCRFAAESLQHKRPQE